MVAVFIHAKFPEKAANLSTWVGERLLKDETGGHITFRPEWGKIELVIAMVELLKHAHRNTDVQRFCFASESCVPLVPFFKAHDVLFSTELSWLDIRTTPNNSWSICQFEDVDFLPRACVMKADQWSMLTRRHVGALLALPAELGGHF